MSTFNFLGESLENQMPDYPKLSDGETVYQVSRAEVREYTVGHSFVLHEPLRRNYSLDNAHIEGTHSIATETDLGETIFTDRFMAEEKAKEYAETHTIWFANDIKVKEEECWEYFRECDGKTLYAWYILMPDSGVLITKGAYTFIHAVDFGTEERARKHLKSVFIPSIEYQKTWDGKKKPYFTKSDKGNIEIKNLYPCKKSVKTMNPLAENPEWDWSEDGYSGIADELTKGAMARKELEEMHIKEE